MRAVTEQPAAICLSRRHAVALAPPSVDDLVAGVLAGDRAMLGRHHPDREPQSDTNSSPPSSA